MNIIKKREGINKENFKDPRNQVKYQEKIQERLEEKESWNNIRESCTEVAEEVLGRKDKNVRIQSKTVKDLSEVQKKMKLDIEVTKDMNKREDLKKERNKIINTLYKEIGKKERKK